MAEQKQTTTVAVHLTEIEAKRFKEFQQFHDNIVLLLASGCLLTRNNSVTLHFDSAGKIQKILKTENLLDSLA